MSDPNPPPPIHQQKLVSVSLDAERLTAHDVVTNRLNANAARVYTADFKQMTSVTPVVDAEEATFTGGFTAAGPVTLGSKEGDVFQEGVNLQGQEVDIDTDTFKVIGATELRVRPEDERDALLVRGGSEFRGGVTVTEHVNVGGNIVQTENEDNAATFQKVVVDKTLDTKGRAEFQDQVRFFNTDEGTEATLHGTQYSGNAATATQLVNEPTITFGGEFFNAGPTTFKGDENVSIDLVPASETSGQIMFTGGDRQEIDSEKVWQQNIKFEPPGEYGIEGGWADQWKNPLRLTLGGDLEGEVQFRGGEGNVTLNARIGQAFGSVPNVRLYASSAEGSDSNPGNTPNFPVRTIKKAAQLAQEYIERRNGKFPNFSKTNFPSTAYQNPGKGSRANTANFVWNDRQSLVESVTTFLELNYPTLSDEPTNVPGFPTVKEICQRDALFLIEAVCSDLTYGGAMNMARAAARYFAQFKRPVLGGTGGATQSGQTRLVLPTQEQIDATIATWNHLKVQIRNVAIDGDVIETIDALFDGFVDTVTDPLPFQTNFSFEARSGPAYGDENDMSNLILVRQANFEGIGIKTYMDKWIEDQVTPFLNGLNPPLDSDFDEETVRAILEAIAEDLKEGGIKYAAKKAGEYFTSNVSVLPGDDVRPIALALQFVQSIVEDDARRQNDIPNEQIDAFGRLMEGVYTTIQFPTTFAPTPVTIFVTSGVYVEEPPIYLAPNVSVVGDSLRSVLVYGNKTSGTDRTDFFHCNSGVYIFNMRFRDIREPGFCAAFPAALVDVEVSSDDKVNPGDSDEDGERRYYEVRSPSDVPSGEARVLFSYPGYTKFNRPKVYVDEPRDSNTIVQELVVTDAGNGYTQNDIDTFLNQGDIKVRDIRERANVKRDAETGEPLMTNFGTYQYYDEDDRNDAWTSGVRIPNIPDRRADFEIKVTDGQIESITLKPGNEGRPMHGKGYRGQAAFIEIPAPLNAGRQARAIVIMKSDYAEMSIPVDGIDEDGRITKVTIDYPGSGYTDVSKPWISIAPPVDLQPYVTASPYIQNCSNLSGPFDQNGNLIPKTLPLPFDVEDVYGDNTTRVDPNGAGGGIRIDGACVAPRSPVPSFVTDAFTQLNQGGIGFLLINRAYAQFVSTFGLFCSTHVKALGGSFANISNTVTDFGLESMHARGYWPVPYAKVDIVPPRRVVEVGNDPKNLPVTDYPIELDAGLFNPTLDQEGHGIYIPNEGYRSEILLDQSASFWGAGYDSIQFPSDDFETNESYYLVTEIDPPPSTQDGNLTARFASDSNEYQALVGSTWVDFEIDSDGEWKRVSNGSVIEDRTTRIRTLTRVTEENLSRGAGEFLPLTLGRDWGKNDPRDLEDRDRFTGAGYKEIPECHVSLMTRQKAVVSPLPEDITRAVEIRLTLSRVTPIAVKLSEELVQRLVRPKFMSVCRINGVWHTVRGVSRVASEDLTDVNPFEPGEYVLTLFPAVNWVNQMELEFFDASYISTNSHAMEYVGSGITYNALPEYGGVPNSASEVVEFSPGRIFFTTQDQLGNTRIGKEFSVDQLSGRVSINTDQFNLAGLSSIGPFRNDDGETVGVQLRSVSNDPNLNSSMPGNTVPTQEAVLAYFSRFLIPTPPSENLTLQSRVVQGALQMRWERPSANALLGTIPNNPDNEFENVVPDALYTKELTASDTVTTGAMTADTITATDMTLSGAFAAGVIGNQDTKVRGVWEGSGTGASSGKLSGIPIVYTCQVEAGSVRRFSFGGGSSVDNEGVRMPRNGSIVFVTVNGGTVFPRIGNEDVGGITFASGSHDTDLAFTSGDTVNFQSTADPTTTMVVSFFVVFE